MTSQRRVLANRRNAARSTGPRSAKGKLSASRNAFRHGLAISVLEDPAACREIKDLALALAGDHPDATQLALARDAATASIELRRVREARLTLMRSINGQLGPPGAPGTGPNERSTAQGGPDTTSEKPVAASSSRNLRKSLCDLSRLERYERRAFSRRKAALRSFLCAGSGLTVRTSRKSPTSA